MERKPRVLIIANSISRSNGGKASLLDLAETIFSLGFTIKFGLTIGHLRHLKNKYRKKNKQETILPNSCLIFIPRDFVARTSLSKRRIINVLNRIISLIQKDKKKFFSTISSSDLIIEGSHLTPSCIRKIKKINNCCIIKNHAGSPKAFIDSFIKDSFLDDYLLSGDDRYKAYCNKYDGALFQSEDQADECIKRGAMIKKQCFIVKPTCKESSVIAAHQLDSPYSNDRKAIVLVGSIQPRKAQDIAVKAFSYLSNNLPKVDLHFVGGINKNNEHYLMNLYEIIENANLKNRVFFHGFRTDYLRFMVHADVLLQTSKSEGVSRVLREAMLMKVPIVSFAISGTTTMLDDNYDAFLVEQGNIKKLAEKIQIILENTEVGFQLSESAFKKYCINNSYASYATSVLHMVYYFTESNLTVL